MMIVDYQPFCATTNLHIIKGSEQKIVKAPSNVVKLAMTVVSTASDTGVSTVMISASSNLFSKLKEEINRMKNNYCPEKELIIKEYSDT